MEKYEVSNVTSSGKLTAQDNELYYDGNLLAVPSISLEGTYFVKEGIKKIYPDAFDEGRDFRNSWDSISKLQAVILSSTVEELGNQSRTGAKFYTRGATPISDEIVYGCESNGTLIKRDGLIYGLYNDEAHILNYNQDEVPADLVIPDTIKARGGHTYPVTRIKRSALNHINLNSIAFGSNLKVIEDKAFSQLRINSDIFFPSNIETIEQNAFTDMQISKEIQIVFDTDVISGVDYNAFYWYYSSFIYDKYIPSIVIKVSSFDMFESLFYHNQHRHFPFFPVKQLITTNGEIPNYGSYFGGFDNDVSNLFIEIDGQKTCFNEISELKVNSYNFEMQDLSYYFPKLEKLTIAQTIIEDYLYDDDWNIVGVSNYYSLFQLMDFLFVDGDSYLEEIKERYQFNDLSIDYYIDLTEEEFIDFVKEQVIICYIEGYDTVNIQFDYDGECFYFDQKYLGYGFPNWLIEGNYDIPLENNVTYTLKIRYSEVI